MNNPRFDTDAASDALSAMAEAIVQGCVDEELEWDALTVVVNLHRQQSMFGYRYADDGNWSPDVRLSMQVLDRAIDLRTTMTTPDGKGWKVCLIQIRRSDMSVQVEFEYKNAKRWRVTPVNLESMVEELRPC
ncbi:hypothetical protein [Nocardia africana]|nr:hypothetical protein [Nocardia africana]MCC3316793.1 hypothetical protein [Nocardia africana]